ncbi:20700_t:CDS:1 [Racocetra persica]|uniref:20700_t:CDS:1 n=1 Tax=Racocetra persica TaxID=160502 RepID=A0ACA9N244_9GLOM|nr:20700_t:CDS:1 [Racocetra persica]
MVNANEWLNKKIPTNERGRAKTLYIYSKCQCKFDRTSQYSQPATTSPPSFGPSFGPFGSAPFNPFAFVQSSSQNGPFGTAQFNPFAHNQSSYNQSAPRPQVGTFGAPSVAKPYNQYGYNNYNNCQHCNNKDQNNCYPVPDYCFCNVILEGELDLNDFVNLKILYIEGIEQNNQQQKLTKLKVDKCIQLTDITIYNTTLGFISLGSKPNLQHTNFAGNKQLSFCDSVLNNQGDRVLNNRGILNNRGENALNNRGDNALNNQVEVLKKQVARLTSLIQSTKATNLNNLKSELKKIEEENFESQLKIIKSRLDEDHQFWLESLVEAHQEVLKINNAFARKQLEQCKKKLADVLTEEEIQEILGKKVEINELETQIKKENVVESKKENVVESKKENVAESKKENVAESKKENVVESKKENVVESKKENVVD